MNLNKLKHLRLSELELDIIERIEGLHSVVSKKSRTDIHYNLLSKQNKNYFQYTNGKLEMNLAFYCKYVSHYSFDDVNDAVNNIVLKNIFQWI